MDIPREKEDVLRDLRMVRIDRTKPTGERIRAYVEQIGDPYRFRVGNTVVSVSYAEAGPSLNECFIALLASRSR